MPIKGLLLTTEEEASLKPQIKEEPFYFFTIGPYTVSYFSNGKYRYMYHRF